MAKYLQRRYDLTQKDALCGERYLGPSHAFYCAAINGHLETAQWLYNFFNLSTRNLHCAKSRGYKKMVQWLHQLL
jgi:hypothetical protein